MISWMDAYCIIRLTDLIQRPNAVYIVTDYLDMVIDFLDAWWSRD